MAITPSLIAELRTWAYFHMPRGWARLTGWPGELLYAQEDHHVYGPVPCPIDLDAFLAGYVDAALWTSSIGDDFAAKHNAQTGADWPGDSSMLDFGLGRDDIDPAALETMRKDCERFVADATDDLVAYCEERPSSAPYDPWQGSAENYAGHDFWLTRNGHGAGFWDRGLGELGDRLTAATKSYGEADLYLGDDDKIYYS